MNRQILMGLSFAFLLGCRPPIAAPEKVIQVRFRPVPSPTEELAVWVVQRVPGATWDAGLATATRHLALASSNRDSRITPGASQRSLALAGYPGNARFARRVNGGALPEELASELAKSALLRAQPVDIALVRRDYADGLTLWIGALAHRPAMLDPIPRDLPLDARLPVNVEVLDPRGSSDPFAGVPNPILFVGRPSGGVSSHELDIGHARYLDVFHEPGVYQVELVARTKRDTQVVLNWSHYVESDPPAMTPLPGVSSEAPNPMDATSALYVELNKLRAQGGVRPLERFEDFEPLAREHAALMAAYGVLGHRIPQVTEGVAARAARSFHPRALHREDLAAAPTWKEALDSARLSPGHLANLLCEECTHASIGVALEPVTDRTPRLFVVWELLEFPEGAPRMIPKR